MALGVGRMVFAFLDRSSTGDRVAAARTELVLVVFLVTAVAVFVLNGRELLNVVSTGRPPGASKGVDVAGVALLLNVALILFGWRRYVDLQMEASLRSAIERQAAIQLATDSVTGLANRRGFAEGVERLCDERLDRSRALVVTSIQLQRFKRINDRHGFETGDALLREIAGAMQADLPPGAVLARLSGESFAVANCLPATGLRDAELVAEAMLRNVSRTYVIDGTFVQVGAFAGVASAAPGVRTEASDLLRRADIALEQSRKKASARPTWFDMSMEQAMAARSELEQSIRAGIEQRQFVPMFEPQIELATGRLTGFEVLARWEHPVRGQLGPELFIPVAEDLGVIGALSESVIAQALDSARRWDPALSLSVNISPSQLSDPWLAQRLVRLLTECNFPAERLMVEVTESSLFSDLELARMLVLSLKNQGVRIALDDFGTGFSSLSHLRLLPLDVIKIDRSFVSSLSESPESAAIVRAVTTLAQALGIPVTAEGLENQEALEQVMALGARTGQGWFLGKPMAAADAEAFARRGSDEGATRRRAG